MVAAAFAQWTQAPSKSHIVPTGRTPWRPVRAAHPPITRSDGVAVDTCLASYPRDAHPQRADGQFPVRPQSSPYRPTRHAQVGRPSTPRDRDARAVQSSSRPYRPRNPDLASPRQSRSRLPAAMAAARLDYAQSHHRGGNDRLSRSTACHRRFCRPTDRHRRPVAGDRLSASAASAVVRAHLAVHAVASHSGRDLSRTRQAVGARHCLARRRPASMDRAAGH
jgi:hypothetical protein